MQDETPQGIIGGPQWPSPSETPDVVESVGISALADEERFYNELVMRLFRERRCVSEGRNDPTARNVQSES